MMPWPALIVLCAVAYLLGSIPTGYLVARWIKGIDVRTVGSGNVGATNVARMVGAKAGIVVLVVDALKGLLAVRWAPAAAGMLTSQPVDPFWAWWAGLAAVVGHDWSCWLQFGGGKGIATSLGVLLGVAPVVAGWTVLVWGVVFAVSRMVSVASILTAAAVPVIVVLQRHAGPYIVVGILLGGIAIIRHNSNIQRILQGSERKFRAS